MRSRKKVVKLKWDEITCFNKDLGLASGLNMGLGKLERDRKNEGGEGEREGGRGAGKENSLAYLYNPEIYLKMTCRVTFCFVCLHLKTLPLTGER